MEKQTISIDTFTAAAQYVKERDYWVQKLSGGLIKSYFPYDNTKGITSHLLTCQNDPVSICFSGEVFLKLMKLSGGHDYTLHMIAAAVVVVLLDKYANNGNKDIIVGVPIYKQDIDSDTEFINSVLALRIQFQENITFKELLFQVRQTMLEANKNKNFPINVLVSMLKMSGRENDFPLFDVAVMLENIHDTSYLRPVNINMVFCLRKTGESVELGVQYNTSRYERATVQRIAAHFNRVIQQVLFNVDLPLPDIELTTGEEKRQLLKDFNDTAAEYPYDKTIHELFAEQVSITPDGVAVIGVERRAESVEQSVGARGAVPLPMDRVSITYGELNQKSNQLAHVLRKKGVKPDAIVGLMVKRSVEMVIGLLAILKAGGAYLPIDPNYPEERKRYMLADGNAVLLLTAPELLDVCRGTACRASICQGTACCAPTNLAYVIYTSGSTGRPKGVLVEQQNVVRLVKNTNYIEFRQNDRILQTGALAFDASTFEIWGALLNGITLCLVPEEDILDPEMLKQDIGKYHISTMWLTSSLFNYFCSEDTGIFTGLKNLLLGGDVLSPLHINQVRERFPGLNILNGYGPTENTTFSATYLITKSYKERIPIGKPIANSTAYILDRCHNLVPVGVVGELHVGGDGVSRGYLNNPELTAERFISISYRSYGSYRTYKTYISKKIYKTGDLARWLADGNIEFIGRMDYQIKIRGFRIEPGEIESRLLSHHLVKEAVVVVREEDSGDKYLCAYMVTHQALAVSQLREYLSEDFPDYMIPSYFVPLEKIPLTANGKVDRAALPIPELGTDGQPVYTAPGDQLEQTLVKIWSEILNLASENLGIDANFFKVGGHSIKATKMIAQLHQELNVKIPLRQVFLTPTIRELAQYIKSVTRKEFTAIAGAENKNYYALSSAQKRLFVLQQLDKKAVGYNIPMAVALEGELDKQRLETTFRGLIRRHESLRTSFEMIQKEPVQRIHDEVEFAIDYKNQKLPIANCQLPTGFVRPFDLSRPPLLRVGLIEEEEKIYILVLDMHHIVSDGTSMGILVKDFMALYSDPDRELSKLRIQYKDFSEWESRLFLSPVMMTQQSYWLGQFENEIPVLNLPTDYPRPGVLGFEGASITGALEGSTVKALKQLALKTESTLFMVLAALYNLLLCKLSTQEDILMGTPIAGRNHADLQEVIGMFVNSLVLRNYPRGNKTVIQFLEEVKERILEALENQDYPFEKLVEQLSKQMERDSSRNPLFDTMFTLQTMEIPELRIPGLKLKPHEFENKIAKFDMSFSASEIGEDLLLNINYSTKLFKKETLQRFLRYFKTITLSVIENPSRQIWEIQFLASEEKQQLLFDFNDTHAPYPREKTVCQLFAEQVQERPDHIAIVGAQGDVPLSMDYISITYTELNRRSNQLAQVLREKGVEPDSIVAIMATPSVEIVIGLMGILKAGGAFLPIDTTYPQERIDYILKDSNARILLAAPAAQVEVEVKVKDKKESIEVIDISKEFFSSTSTLTSTCQVSPANLAYIIYTSGSSGKPKGVMIRHRSLVNLLWWYKNYYSPGPTDRMAKYSAFGFDATIMEIFPGLIAGAPVYVLDDDVKLDIEKLNRYFETHHITVCHLPTPVAEQYMTLDNRSLRVLLAGGDKLNHYIQRRYRLENNYGPTEGTVVATVFPVETDSPNIPIGKPIFNTVVYILDRHGQLQPIGVPGEMCIGGDGLARGYLNRPELTAEKFLFISYKSYRSYRSYKTYNSKKIYKTGDLARWLPDGNIEFLGRMDFQVKIRGYRIELGEIENCLLKHPQVKEAVVLSRANKTGTKFLCAYVILAGAVDKPVEMAAEFKIYLSQSLPNYMIPAYFVHIEKVPKTANGKIDRKALPQPVFQSTADYIMPKTLREKRVAGTWKEILGVENVGVDDNFFELGGNSLNIIQLGARLKETLQIDIPTVILFRFPTIRTFLGYLQKQETGAPEDKRALEKEEERERGRTKSVERGKRMMKQAVSRRERRN